MWRAGEKAWLLQPDINVPAYLPIVSIDVPAHTLRVRGDYESLVPSGEDAPHFRIYAPPGIERRGPQITAHKAGLHSRYVSATSSRNLFCGYRYETPAAGFTTGIWQSPPIARQDQWNFAGTYYTLNRHYDPFLMRFTSNDPAASPFFNLFSYCGNSPGSGYDPDGLFLMRAYVQLLETIFTGKNAEGKSATWADYGEAAWGANPITGFLPGAANPFSFVKDIQNSESFGGFAWSRFKRMGIVGGMVGGSIETGIAAWKSGQEEGFWSGVGTYFDGMTRMSPIPLVGSTYSTVQGFRKGCETGNWWDFAKGFASMGDDVMVLGSFTVGSGKGDSSVGKYKHLNDPPSVKPGGTYTPQQRKVILAENRRMNNGILRHDETGKPLDPGTRRVRGSKVNPNEAVVDHWIPRKANGPNSFANARVISFADNMTKLDKMPIVTRPHAPIMQSYLWQNTWTERNKDGKRRRSIR